MTVGVATLHYEASLASAARPAAYRQQNKIVFDARRRYIKHAAAGVGVVYIR